MRFPFLLLVTALVACMSVTACHHTGKKCDKESECCTGLKCLWDGDRKGHKTCQ
ncbi:hypothetical protein BDR03DRAFT_940055 [Suillus americanus]|nr:hypothetical protein BDR03DRAFT_940055 [Suillus americanus]